MGSKSKRRKNRPSQAIQPQSAPQVGTSRGTGKRITLSHHQEFSQGPIPPPEQLAKYEDIIPNGADRIMALAESEAVHRREMEHKIIDAQVVDAVAERSERRNGQYLGFAIGIIALISGSYVATKGGQPIAGAFIGAGGVAGLVSVFIYGRKVSPKESPEE